jgi:hypothetical protein
LDALTPFLLQQTLQRMRDALDGRVICGCGENGHAGLGG